MIAALVFLSSSALAPAREVRLVMGTSAEVWVKGLADASPALDAAFAALDVVDREMSLFKDDSDLVRLNRSGGAVVPLELLAVVRHALDVAAASQGAFDPTVEPLVRASGGLGGKPRRLSSSERRRLLARVGWTRVHVEPGASRVRLEPGAALDLGGIAKGYAADLALAALRQARATAALVDLGGSSLGVFGEPLTVDVRNPVVPGGRPWASFQVVEAHVATSGGDQSPGHIFDPRTGLPADTVLSATVVAPTGMEADALATALFVLGPERGLELVRQRGDAGLVLLREGRGGKAVARTTPGFREAYALELGEGVSLRP